MAAALALLGCGDDARPSRKPRDVLWSSEHFDYYTRTAETAACESVLSTLEQHRAVVTAFFGLPESPTRITYRKYLDEADLEASAACPSWAAACQHSAIIESPRVLEEHELIHAYFDSWGSAPPLIAEGVAEALTCEGDVPWMPPLVDWRTVSATTSVNVYDAGRWFVGHLLWTFGPEPFMRFYQGDWFHASADEMQSRFAAVYGRDLDEVWQQAFAAPLGASNCVHLWECAAPPIGLNGDALSFAERCDGGGKYGTVTVDQPALLELRGGKGMVLKGCGNRGPNLDPPGVPGEIVAELEPGTVFLTTSSVDPPWHATLRPAPSDDAGCPVVAFGTVPSDDLEVWTIARPARSAPFVVSLPTPVDAELQMYRDSPIIGVGATATAALCGDCSASDCVAVPWSTWTRRSVGAIAIEPRAPAPDGFIYVSIAARAPASP